jgi:uncharacterized protein (DUF2062 family)
MKSFFRKLKASVVDALKQGWSPSQVCWSSAWGWTIGLFPIYGVTTVTLGVIGWVWKLNHSILQGFNYLVSPLKFILILPYVRLGEWMFQVENGFSLSIPEFTRQFKAAPMETLGEFAMTFVHAICGWLVSTPIWMATVYFVMALLLRAGQATRAQLQEINS